MRLGDANFFPSTPNHLETGAKENLQKHLLELEMTLLEKRTELNFALDTIARLERRIKELESA